VAVLLGGRGEPLAVEVFPNAFDAVGWREGRGLAGR